MKFSLISATSIFALLSASAGVAQAGVFGTARVPSNLYDLVHDGMTSSDGGDRTVASQDLSVSATAALEAATRHWRTSTATGSVDLTAEIQGYPVVPLGAAPGTAPEEELASSVTGSGQWDVVRKARALGQARVAALIGTVGNGPPADDKSDSTVFVSVGSSAGFNGGNELGPRVNAYAFAPSSTSTATITVAGGGNLSRQGFGGGFGLAASNSLQAVPPTIADAAPPVGALSPPATVLADTLQPSLGYQYAPVNRPARKDAAVAASFSDAVTASGNLAQNMTAPAKIQTSQLQAVPGRGTTARVQTSQLQDQGQPSSKTQTSELQPGQGNLGRLQTSEVDTRLSQLIDLSGTAQGENTTTHVDGTRTMISASVSANPSATAALYMANAVNAARAIPDGQSVEAFQIGPTSGPRQAGPGSTVSDPLHGKVMASAGALNNSLALP